MNESKHTPEPWRVDESGWIESSKPGILIHSAIDDVCISREDANRIVACVNACKGINPEAVPGLLAACKAWDEGFIDGVQFTPEQFLVWVNERRKMARDAIAKAVS